jgi:hypothetical protein
MNFAKKKFKKIENGKIKKLFAQTERKKAKLNLFFKTKA